MSNDQYEQGMAKRREVMGDAFVDRALNNSSEFVKALQDMVTRNCWGETWQSDALPAATRSLITISILTALRASTELKGHVRGALNNGVSKAEIQSIIHVIGIYCGVPQALECFRVARKVLEEADQA